MYPAASADLVDIPDPIPDPVMIEINPVLQMGSSDHFLRSDTNIMRGKSNRKCCFATFSAGPLSLVFPFIFSCDFYLIYT
jgi:hypothetical protein